MPPLNQRSWRHRPSGRVRISDISENDQQKSPGTPKKSLISPMMFSPTFHRWFHMLLTHEGQANCLTRRSPSNQSHPTENYHYGSSRSRFLFIGLQWFYTFYTRGSVHVRFPHGFSTSGSSGAWLPYDSLWIPIFSDIKHINIMKNHHAPLLLPSTFHHFPKKKPQKRFLNRFSADP